MTNNAAARDVFARFADDRRNLELPGYEREVLAHVTRYTPDRGDREGILLFTSLRSAPDDAIDAEIRHFEARGLDFEWKVYDFDQPGDLKERLHSRGFDAGEEEAFLLLSTEASGRTNAEIDVRRIDNRAGLAQIAEVQEELWNANFDWLIDELERTLAADPSSLSLYIAYDGGKPIATAWTAFHASSAYPELHGGGVLPRYRGNGIYGDLVHRRLIEARERGYRHVAIDASPMSRPIVEGLGANFVCWTTPMRWQRGSGA